MWFGANMADRRNKNAFKCVLQVLILSQTQPLGIKNVVWGGLEVVWGGLEVVWGGLGCFGVVWGVSTDPRPSIHPSIHLSMSPCLVFHNLI